MNCQTNIIEIKDLLQDTVSKTREKIFADILGGSWNGIDSEKCIGTAFSLPITERGGKSDKLENSGLCVVRGAKKKGGKHQTYVFLNVRNEANSRFAADGMFGAKQDVRPEEIKGTELYKFLGNMYPSNTLLLTSGATNPDTALRFTFDKLEFSTYGTNGWWIDYDINSKGGFRHTHIAEQFLQEHSEYKRAKCRWEREQVWTGNWTDRMTDGYVIENFQRFLLDLDSTDFNVNSPIYIVLRVAKEKKMTFEKFLSSIQSLEGFVSLIPGIQGLTGALSEFLNEGVGQYAKEVASVINSTGLVNDSTVTALSKGEFNIKQLAPSTSQFLSSLKKNASFLSPEAVRGVEHFVKNGKDGLKLSILGDVFGQQGQTYQKILQGNYPVREFLGVDVKQIRNFTQAMNGKAKGILTNFKSIAPEAAENFDIATKRLQNLKNLTISDTLIRYASSNANVDLNMIGGDVLGSPVMQQLGVMLTDQSLGATLPSPSKLFGKMFGDPAGLSGIYSLVDDPTKLFHNAFASAKGFPTDAKNWLEFSTEAIKRASEDNPKEPIVLPPCVDGDLRECIRKRLHDAGREVLMCDEGWTYNASTGQCESNSFFGGWKGKTLAIGALVGTGVLAAKPDTRKAIKAKVKKLLNMTKK